MAKPKETTAKAADAQADNNAALDNPAINVAGDVRFVIPAPHGLTVHFSKENAQGNTVSGSALAVAVAILEKDGKVFARAITKHDFVGDDTDLGSFQEVSL